MSSKIRKIMNMNRLSTDFLYMLSAITKTTELQSRYPFKLPGLIKLRKLWYSYDIYLIDLVLIWEFTL